MSEKIDILGVKYDNFTRVEFNKSVEHEILNGNKISLSLSNPEFVIQSRNNPKLKNYLNEFVKYNVPDGIGILYASRLLKTPLKERITGTDFIIDICEISSRNGFNVFFLGGKPGTPDKAKQYFIEKFPNLNVVGVQHGYFDNDREIINEINNYQVDVLIVCFGCPKQESWIESNFSDIDAKLIFGNGGAFDYYSDNVKRAPDIILKFGLEWMYRLYQDPTINRFKRQLFTVPKFIYLAFSAKIKKFILHR
ncbi:hypothetical protein A148_12225 [Vibrio splendidus 1F-157]|uniref:WecB/TagA/CpsF family glycosyltransferase n=1 Tax=Vibrio splendidus TaxID=29497 RepID=UPI0002D98FC6|nr:WecB/TagA/CpsF family glycosyltransferase [Vibrio splendidus]OEF79688.1 hypothetical protein A148_12225 [Vibrio splendidus 1F-157]